MSVNDPMMESKHHDPMCPAASPLAADGWDCQCALIAKVRADEREVRDKWWEAVVAGIDNHNAEAYRMGQRDEREACIAAVEELRDENREGTDPEWGVLNMAVAAIAALKGATDE